MPAVLAFLSGWEIGLVLLVALLFFGTRLPKVARSAGQSVSEFKKGMKELKDDVKDAVKDEDAPKI